MKTLWIALHKWVANIKAFGDQIHYSSYARLHHVHKVRKFKNINQGKRCFIIGNGPSLTIADLEMLQNEDCFACNRIYGLFTQTSWRPRYYCIQDKRVLKQIAQEIPLAVKEADAAFFPYNYQKILPRALLNEKNVNLFYHLYVSTYTSDGTYPEGLMPFSDDITKGMYDGLSVTYGMIQLAVYMGYKEIYLLGIDHNYVMKNGIVDASKSYCEGLRPIDMTTQFPPELRLCEVSFREARRFAEQHGIVIRNATRGGKLEVFERIDLDKVLQA